MTAGAPGGLDAGWLAGTCHFPKDGLPWTDLVEVGQELEGGVE